MSVTRPESVREPSARERLLDTAERLFYAEGVHTVGIDRVLAESGVAKATLYKNFGNKDGLVTAYLDRRHERQVARVTAALDAVADGSPRERILAAAAELGYDGPDPSARALARGRTGSVGLLLDDRVSQVFRDSVKAYPSTPLGIMLWEQVEV